MFDFLGHLFDRSGFPPRTEEKLREEQRRFRAVFNQQFQFMAILAPDGTVLEANDTCFRATGVARERTLGHLFWETPWWDRLPAMQERWKRSVAEAVRSGNPVTDEVDYSMADGSVRHATVTVSGLKDEAGHVTTLIVEGQDDTDRKRAEESLRQADRRKNEFLATLAHELRNPLDPIRNAVELLQGADGNADLIRQASGMMQRQVRQMVRLIDDLLDISRITSGKLQLRQERVLLATVIQSAVESACPLIEAQSHELTLAVPREPIYLDADPTRLAQVFANLLNNAAKYTEKRGRIWLSAERQGRQAVVSVCDTGIGIPAEHLPYVFEMFSQVAPALERSQAGLGIGLALVKGVVDLHGGTVEAHSTSGKGSEFIVRLPIVEGSTKGSVEKAEHGKPAQSQATLRILVADDNQDAADSLALVLRTIGHDIQTAHDGVEAVQAAAAFRPHVALLDIGMPKMNGYEVAQRIREQSWGKRIVLVALTGWGQEEDKRRATEAGFHYHLTKPAEPLAVERLLEGLTQPKT
jgi:PAS domain S-box-containing protein